MKPKRCKYFFLAVLACLFFSIGEVKAFTIVSTPDTLIARIYYRINSPALDTTFRNNASVLDIITDFLEKSDNIKSINIQSFSSPEGSNPKNDRLAKLRGQALKDYILGRISKDNIYFDSSVTMYSDYDDWEKLAEVVEEIYHRKDKNKILKILQSGKSSDEVERNLRALDRDSWNIIANLLMPDLRYAECVIVNKTKPVAPPVLLDEEEPIQVYEIPVVADSLDIVDTLSAVDTMHIGRDTTIFALKTNLLYDAVTWLNISLEVPLGNHLSILYEHQAPWWRAGEAKNYYCMRYLQMSGEFRWWFHHQQKPMTRHDIVRDRLTGHFLALYGMGGKYDFEWGRKICYQGEFWSAGLTYGYSLPVGRNVNMEFFLSVGYANIDYRHYIPSEDFEILFYDPDNSGKLHYIGPTKIGVSLVVPITMNGTKRAARKELKARRNEMQ